MVVGIELRIEKEQRMMRKLAVWLVVSEAIRARWSMVIPMEDDGGEESVCAGRRSRQLELEVAATQRGGEGEPIPWLGQRWGGRSGGAHQ
jgi:hypothetical protein